MSIDDLPSFVRKGIMADLGHIMRQCHGETPLIRVTPAHPDGGAALTSADRVKYAAEFLAMQQDDDKKLDFIPCRAMEFVVSVQRDVGQERLYAFRINIPGDPKVFLLVASDAQAAKQFIARVGKAHCLKRLCSWCGAEGSFKKCPCKAVRYCNGDCQKQHWRTHKPKCTFQR